MERRHNHLLRTLGVITLGLTIATSIDACGPPPSTWDTPEPAKTGLVDGAEHYTGNPRLKPEIEPTIVSTPEKIEPFIFPDMVDSVASAAVSLHHKEIDGGDLFYTIVDTADRAVGIEILTADNQTPTTINGDTAWTDQQPHNQSLPGMVAANPVRKGKEFVFGQTADYQGERHTSNEGTVVYNGQILRVNSERAALCWDGKGIAQMGRYTQEELEQMGCHMAFGAGPVVMKDGLIAKDDFQAGDEQQGFMPWNPLSEGFKQMDYRKQIFNGKYPHTYAGYGMQNGRQFTIFVSATLIDGPSILQELQKIGVTDAMICDDDSKTSMLWNGNMSASIGPGDNGSLSSAIAVYVKKN